MTVFAPQLALVINVALVLGLRAVIRPVQGAFTSNSGFRCYRYHGLGILDRLNNFHRLNCYGFNNFDLLYRHSLHRNLFNKLFAISQVFAHGVLQSRISYFANH